MVVVKLKSCKVEMLKACCYFLLFPPAVWSKEQGAKNKDSGNGVKYFLQFPPMWSLGITSYAEASAVKRVIKSLHSGLPVDGENAARWPS